GRDAILHIIKDFVLRHAWLSLPENDWRNDSCPRGAVNVVRRTSAVRVAHAGSSAAWVSSPSVRRIGKIRLAFLEEVSDALNIVFRLHAELELGVGDAERLAEGLEHGLPDLRLHDCKRARRDRVGNRRGKGLHVIAERSLREHL